MGKETDYGKDKSGKEDVGRKYELPEKTGKRAKFRKWKVVFHKSDIHPRVMLRRSKIQKKKKVTTAKLHLPKSPDENRKDVIYFWPSPNPEIKDLPGAYYSKLKNDDPESLVGSEALKSWRISRDGKRKMRRSLRAKEAMRRTMGRKKAAKERARKKEKQAYLAKDQTPRQPRLCIHIKPLFRRKGKRRR